MCLLTGRPFTSFREPAPPARPVAGIWLSLPRDVLHKKIETRAGQLFENGVEQEVRNALPLLGASAKQAIGVKDVQDVLEGKSTREKAIERIIFATRQYARRQETWFRKEPGLAAKTPEEARAFCVAFLEKQAARGC